jgi:hypothetical protein
MANVLLGLDNRLLIMKKIIIISVILVAGVWAMSMRGHCELESEQTHKVAKPIVEALAAYAKENGIPNLDNFDQIKGIPYKLQPCSQRPDLEECKNVYNGYYFKLNEELYIIRMWEVYPSGFGLEIMFNYTNCGYTIYKNNKIKTTYLQPACSLNNKCSAWFRQ